MTLSRKFVELGKFYLKRKRETNVTSPLIGIWSQSTSKHLSILELILRMNVWVEEFSRRKGEVFG